MKKVLFWFLFLFVGIPAFALIVRYIPKADYVWMMGGILGALAILVGWLASVGKLPTSSAAARYYDLEKARHEGYQAGHSVGRNSQP